ncbi:MAG: peptidoglycan bridge formation glycyltransferase FemA/FemB family protein [Candidatus Uhrbacteria bacterium]|nr:peptidoglycan bridge formation glycyltransferase FemA/FemB family protein [Candidatus Uhrbacteria bacterium]
MSRRVLRIHKEDGGKEMLAQAIEMDLPFGHFYWYLPKGPIGSMSLERKSEVLRAELPDAMFLRVEPVEESRMLQVYDVQPSNTLVLDLTMGEDKLLSQMKSKTRYNIRLSNKKGVECKFVNVESFEDFIRLMDQTTQRDKFIAHPEVYYKTMLEAMASGEAKASLAAAFYEGRPIAMNIVMDFAGTRSYLHGATSNLHRNVMAQYALHWFLIEDAIAKGMSAFDFWGIAPIDADEKHSWAGITRYKLGFGGERLSMPGTFDLPTKHFVYSLYRMGKKLRTGR